MYIYIHNIHIYVYIYMVYIDAHLVLAIPIAMLDETGEIMKQEGKRCFSYQHNPKPWHLAAPIWCIHQRPGSEASFGVTVVPCGKAAIFLPYPSSWGSFCIPFGFMAVYHLQPLGGIHEEFTLHPAPHRYCCETRSNYSIYHILSMKMHVHPNWSKLIHKMCCMFLFQRVPGGTVQFDYKVSAVSSPLVTLVVSKSGGTFQKDWTSASLTKLTLRLDSGIWGFNNQYMDIQWV